MKWQIFITGVLLFSCSYGPVQDNYNAEMPELPAAWTEILGAPNWRLEWINSNGKWESWEGREGIPALPLMQEWTSPVFAWPYWPEKGIYPGLMSPAGALFPWDAQGTNLVLSWQAGVDAFFWRELSLNSEVQNSGSTPRLPWHFNWPRFRELMQSENVPDEIQHDPWLADWKEIARKTVESGFDRRRIKARTRTKITVAPYNEIWAGYSSFAPPVTIQDSGQLIFNVCEIPETWVSKAGFLRCQDNAFIFIPW